MIAHIESDTLAKICAQKRIRVAARKLELSMSDVDLDFDVDVRR